jgi:tetratricopeptide (TPR) repeat protein
MPSATLAPELESTLALDDETPDAVELNLRGIRRHSEGDPAGALDDFLEATLADPGLAEAWNNAGIARQGLGDLAAALDDFDRAIAVRPGYADALNNRGRAHQLLGDLEAARRDFDLAVESAQGPFQATSLHNRATLRRETGDLNGALADFDWALKAAPERVVTRISRADARKASGDLAGAMADLDRAIELTPEAGSADILHRRAGIRVLRNDFAGAIADYDRAIGLEPGFALAYLSRGHARYHLRDFRGIADYRTALRLDPDAAIRDLARLFLADIARDPEAVLANCDKHLRIDASDVLAHARRGLTLLLLGRDPRADLERFVELAPDLQDHLHRVVDAASNRSRRP